MNEIDQFHRVETLTAMGLSLAEALSLVDVDPKRYARWAKNRPTVQVYNKSDKSRDDMSGD